MASLALEFPADFRAPNTGAGWLDVFLSLCPVSPWGIQGHAFFPATVASSVPRRHLVLGFGVHGNEWGTLPAAVALLLGLGSGRIRCQGPVSLLLGNLDALRCDVRFLDEDFNRVFSFDRPADNRERRRAEVVRPVLDAADLFVDFHQTQTPTESAFWTFPWSEELGLWARVMGAAPRGLVRAPGGAFSVGKKCLDEYVRDRGKCGMTVELGEKGPSDDQARAAYAAALRLFWASDAVSSEGKSLRDLAQSMPELEWYETVEVLAPPDATARLRPGLCCFTPVQRGEVLSAPGSPVLRASHDAVVMFPKYPASGEGAPPELLRLAARIGSPSERYRSLT